MIGRLECTIACSRNEQIHWQPIRRPDCKRNERFSVQRFTDFSKRIHKGIWGAQGRLFVRSAVMMLLSPLLLFTTARALVAAGTSGQTFYIAANGSDANSGTSNTSPWLHAPGMPTCTGNCAAHTPAPGDQFIFRGGDTWHFGNSTASPYVGGAWNWKWNGSSGSPIYIGVDKTWYSGSVWSRPVLNGDNPTSTSTTLSSCTYQVPGGNVFVNFGGKSYFTFDNFEFAGLCQSSTGSPFAQDAYVLDGSANHALFEHLYFHGWTHVQFNCGSQCFNAGIFVGGQGGGQQIGLQYQYIVVDGSDSDPAGAQTFYDGMYDVSYSVFTHAAQMIGSLCHLFHDNLVDNWYDPGDGHAHGNVYECVGEAPGTNAVYNNVIRHISPNGVGQVNFWPEPDVGTTDYYFGNVMYDVRTGGNYFNIGQNSSAQGTINIFNNTFEQPANGYGVLFCNSSNSHPFTATNNNYILDGGSPYSSPCTGGTFVTERAMTHSTAAANGYSSTQSFVYSPTAASNPTVNKGTNVASYCSALATAGLSDAVTACQSDTRYACTYSVSDHTVNCPTRVAVARPSGAWDIGAYQFSSTQASAPNAPTNLTAVVQ
jgi:hypothetical protein